VECLFCFGAEIGQLEHFFFLQMEQSSFCPSNFSELLLKEAYQLPYDISQKALLCCSVSKISTFYLQINFPSLKFQLIGSSFVCLPISFLHPKGNTSSSSYLSYFVKQNLKLGTFASKSHIQAYSQKKCVYMSTKRYARDFHSSIIHKCSKMKTTQMPIRNRREKYMVYSY